MQTITREVIAVDDSPLIDECDRFQMRLTGENSIHLFHRNETGLSAGYMVRASDEGEIELWVGAIAFELPVSDRFEWCELSSCHSKEEAEEKLWSHRWIAVLEESSDE